MSFSNEVKEEALLQFPKAEHCRKAELAAFLLHCGRIERDGEGIKLTIASENESFLRKCFTILEKTYNIVDVCPDSRKVRGTKQEFFLQICSDKTVRELLRDLKLSGAVENGLENETADPALFSRSCCVRSFLRGCFICSGSVSAPDKSNHLEFGESTAKRALMLQDLLRGSQIDAGVVVRKKSHVVYIKDGDQLADVLTMIGAKRAVLAFREGQVVKDVRNSVNRQVNCETANLNKTVFAAFSQIEDIRLLEAHHVLRTLPKPLKELAKTRLDMPEASLTELGQLLDPPVSKSGVNHRLKKLRLLADEIREKEEEDYDHKDNDGSDSDRA